MLCNQRLLSLKTMRDTTFATICIYTADINPSCKKQRKREMRMGEVKQVRDTTRWKLLPVSLQSAL